MTTTELKLLQTLLCKLKKDKPKLNVLVTDLSDSEVHELTHSNSKNFYCDLNTQIEICLDDEENPTLR